VSLGAVVASATLILALLGVAPASAAVTPSLVRYVPDPWISGHAGLYGWGMTTAADGSVLIGDYWNYRVGHFAKNGTYLGDFYNNHGFGPNKTQSPYGLATDPNDGSVYIADTDQYQIVKVDASGNTVLSWGQQGSGPNNFLYPSRVAVASDGRVFVADTWDNNIVIDQVNDATGTVTELGQFGSFGTADGQMKQPHGMSFYYGAPGVADDKLFVVDTNNKRIEVFDQSGAFLYKFGSATTAGGKFQGDLRGLAIDQNNGWVYIVDAAGNNIDKYTVGGTYLLSFGSEGSTNGKFSDGGREITVDGDGNVWVGDMPNFRAQKFSPTGQYLLQVPTTPAPPPTGGFNGPRSVALDSAGNMFVTDMYNQRIEKFAPDGSFLLAWGSRGRDDYAFNYPRMLDVDPNDGSVVVCDTDNHAIKKFSNDGVFQWSVGGLGTQLGLFKNPHGIAVGADSKIYVADSRNSRVVILSPAGVPLSSFGSNGTGLGQFKFPRGITVAPDGTLWVVDSTRHIVQHFTATGGYLGKFGKFGTTPGSFDGPFDIAADSNYLYIAESAQHRVDIYTNASAPVFVTSFGGYGTASGQMISPDGLDVGPNGHVYVAEEVSERISEWDIAGVATPPDSGAPSVVISLPTNNQQVPRPVSISGTAADDISGVAGVQIAIKDRVTNRWWNPASNTWGSTVRGPGNFITTTLGSPGALSTSWSYTWNGASAAGQYSVSARATDVAGNMTDPLPSRIFRTI
jgi:sugar lactone lactonase YvrE